MIDYLSGPNRIKATSSYGQRYGVRTGQNSQSGILGNYPMGRSDLWTGARNFVVGKVVVVYSRSKLKDNN